MANELAKRLAARVRQFREASGLSQEAFAERAGLKYKHYQSWEAGRKIDIRFSTLEKLAVACGVELSKLLDLDAAPKMLAEDPPGKNSGRTKPRRRKRKGSGIEA
ncbi:MAG TPA: helix-turn-helix transcriptional regulator [Opitutaceae bacterium]|nr:helix-turn-helix transcriptional regulator [Opitutaceae bacterium]